MAWGWATWMMKGISLSWIMLQRSGEVLGTSALYILLPRAEELPQRPTHPSLRDSPKQSCGCHGKRAALAAAI